MSIPQEQAVEALNGLIAEIDPLKEDKAFSEAHTRWLSNVLAVTEEIFGPGSTTYLSIASLTWRRTGSFILDPSVHGTRDINEISRRIHHEAYLKQLDTAKGLLRSGLDQLKLLGIDKVYKKKEPGDESKETIKVLDLARNKLRKTIRGCPNHERDVQDRFEDLLIASDIGYLREQEKVVYSSKTYHPDFCLPKINTVVEIKLCNAQRREKSIISEINDDILAYKTKYPNLVFIVYDVGYIRDVDRFRRDIESEHTVIVEVVKY